ncbi:hypothetical protein [Adhaeribacter radiodurans]|uniref:Uncharacterized protein n=1 Tax=Adhaeribacter radiodurans TaxID=2745197 RepID=A0A7L7L6A2_9BACT|nr:hypothetical protein [Adhaeribacter radiodurans]QMU28366.1 hypothetical protein HUW48_10115 [Adhaeribacter radiodurans]
MSSEMIKSPMQLKYELDNTKNELVALLNSWKKKSAEWSGRIVTFRADLKEIDAVMAATELSYTAYCALAKPILGVIKPSSSPLQVKQSKRESLPSESSVTSSVVLNQILSVTQAAVELENNRIDRLRDEHQTQSTFIHQKSKEIYRLLNEEKKNVDSYTTLLQSKIQGLEEQYALQTQTNGLGRGL